MRAPSSPAPRNRTIHRRKALPLLVASACAVVIAVALLAGVGKAPSGAHPPATRARASTATKTGHANTRIKSLVERRTGSLQAPVQDAAGVALDRRRAMLLGGLTAADTSRADVRVVTPAGDRSGGSLPTAVHDTAAVRLGGAVYLFGGGTNVNIQSDAIVRVPAGGGASSVVGRLPAPSSDQAAAAIGGTAYVVGGYTGRRWLDTIVAWRPGAVARAVARLPFPLRYGAVTAARSERADDRTPAARTRCVRTSIATMRVTALPTIAPRPPITYATRPIEAAAACVVRAGSRAISCTRPLAGVYSSTAELAVPSSSEPPAITSLPAAAVTAQ